MLSTSEYDRIRKAIIGNRPIILRTSSYTAPHRDYVDRVLSLYLYELGLLHLHNNLAYCLHELAGNARNALLKRIYFAELGLDITDPAVYTEKMQRFRQDTTADIQRYLRLLEEGPYNIRFHFSHTNERVQIRVENNTALLPIEVERIRSKVAAARHYSSLADAYASLVDFTEGAGLGIAMVVVILKSLGLGPDALQIGSCGTAPRSCSTINVNRIDREAPDLVASRRI
jgi:hypothetical protein